MRPPGSGNLAFRGTGVLRCPRPAVGSALRQRGWPSPRWLWLLVPLVVIAVALLASQHADPPKPPAVSVPKAPHLRAPSAHVPSLPAPDTPRIGAPHIGTPAVSAPDVSGPHVSAPSVGVKSPSVDGPDIHEPGASISFGWLLDFFSVCWRVIWILLTLPWWVILLAVLTGRWLWIAWKRRREEREQAENRQAEATPVAPARRAAR
jgi:hypothetical protein